MSAADPNQDPEMVLAGFQPGGVRLWQAWGATGVEIREWSAAEFGPADAACWKAYREDITPQIVNVLIDEDDADLWLRSSIATDRLVSGTWVSAHPAGAEPWAAEPDFDPAAAGRLIASGFAHPAEFRYWQGVNPGNPAAAMTEAWADDPKPSGNWDRSDPMSLCCEWDDPTTARCAGLWQPDVFREWRTAAIGMPHHPRWDTATGHDRMFSVADALALHPQVTPAEFTAWQAQVRAHPAMISNDPDGESGSTAVLWLNTFKDLTVTADRVRVWTDWWVRPGRTHHWTWLQLGDPDLVAAWSNPDNNPAMTADTAVAWHRAGFSPGDHDWLALTVRLVLNTQRSRPSLTPDGVFTIGTFNRDIIPLAALVRRRGGSPDDLIDLVEHYEP